MSAKDKKAELSKLLYVKIRQLDTLSEQLNFLRAFEHELAQVTRKKGFRIWNRSLWHTLLNARDGLAVHIASWAKSMYEDGGLFGTISGKSLVDALAMGSKREGSARDASERELVLRHRKKHFARLFPGVKETPSGKKPTADHVEKLRTRFAKRCEPLHDDRNAYRAHLFEKKIAANVRQLHTPGRAQFVNYAQKLLNDLLLLCDRSTYGFPDVRRPSKGDAQARDLVDLLLNGTITFAVGEWTKADGQYLWQQRAKYYEALHARHDALPNNRKHLFNDRLLPTGELIT
jgi:hypothetical protein